MDGCCRIVDEIDFVSAASTTWSMHTMATVHINGADGSSASLSMGGADLHATIVGESNDELFCIKSKEHYVSKTRRSSVSKPRNCTFQMMNVCRAEGSRRGVHR